MQGPEGLNYCKRLRLKLRFHRRAWEKRQMVRERPSKFPECRGTELTLKVVVGERWAGKERQEVGPSNKKKILTNQILEKTMKLTIL